ncbi:MULTISPECIES: hypothetical protein [Myroides]|uniref:Fibronectin type-III domain-containing protein n=1 Tax=Myroides albus TaxID=2562892 RepID=A0A6I3LEL5_9FLAO|nr:MULTISPECIES: hypothetical protein [Myroides]MTG97909.1 hypothetical protein [Myroides albus]MVX34778.1 hypothetical protein [Myroides sp. LoEW2-1]UVD81097.1 hypothetical protein NWE55_07560 [Myroides albus]
MKKRKLTWYTKGLCAVVLCSFISCSSDDNSTAPNVTPPTEEPNPEGPKVKEAEISLAVIAYTQNTATVQINSKEAKSVYYYVVKGDDVSTITVEEIVSKGVKVKANTEEEVVVDALEANTKYTVTAIAINAEDKATILKYPQTIKTMQSATMQIIAVEADITTMEFKFTTQYAEKVGYIVQEATEKAPTAEDVLAKGVSIDRLDGESTLKVDGLSENTKYNLYVAAIEASGKTLLQSSEFSTKEDVQEEDGVIKFTEIKVNSESQGWLNVYILNLKGKDWEAGFEIGSISAELHELPTGKFYYASWSEEVSSDGVGEYFIKKRDGSESIRDLDSGSIVITKGANNTFDIEINIARDSGTPFKAIYNGPVQVIPY